MLRILFSRAWNCGKIVIGSWGYQMKDYYKRINKDLLASWTLIVVILTISYCMEVLKGTRTVSYAFLFLAVASVPLFVCFFLYKKNPDSHKLCYYILIGYAVMYTFAMATGGTMLVFVYILPLLSFLVVYHNLRLIIFSGVATLLLNLGFILYRIYTGEITLANSRDTEIQIALIFLCFVGAGFASVIIKDLVEKNTEVIDSLDEKSKQIQRMTLQTIETIANTIDAKDEYTKGHSRRVAEYSAEIAKDMGLSSEQVDNIRYIALLHDIGKIGVPDAVLNKPGRLTDSEYELMKSHTLIGADILKDIGMLPDLDVGAKYHHERYDGKGYPSGLKGEEIPLVARIICMADSYDAMTSNRVYRKHLSRDVVMEEIRRCRGTQFDPEITDAFLNYLSRQPHDLAREIEEEELEPGNRLLKKIMEDQNKQLIENAEKDQLTKVYNRSAGERYITIAFRDTVGALLLLNLDDMRRINRQNGFRRGDYYITTTVEILRSLEDDIIISRFGGDEFLCYIPGLTDESRISALMDDLMHRIHTSGVDSPKEFNFGLTASAGIAIHDHTAQDFNECLSEAEKALYYKKQTGKDGYYFYHQVADSQEDFTIRELNNLVSAIREKDNFSDSMILEKQDFQRISSFIQDVVREQKKNVALIMFTAAPSGHRALTVEDRDRAMNLLETAILKCVNGDENAISYYSSVQRIVIFEGETEAALKKVASDIMKKFYQTYDENNLELQYQITDLRSA